MTQGSLHQGGGVLSQRPAPESEVSVNSHARSASRIQTLAESLAFCALFLPALSAAAPTIIATGSFAPLSPGLFASGAFEIRQDAGKYTLALAGEFKVSDGPDLFLTFNPLPVAKVTGENAKTYSLKITPELRSLQGAQTYDLPGDFAVEKYGSLLIYCWKFDHLYAGGEVKKTAATALAAPERLAGKEGSKKPALTREGGKMRVLKAGTELRRYDLSGRVPPAGKR
jgi:hypothetical protein